jgi:hypothetical protein
MEIGYLFESSCAKGCELYPLLLWYTALISSYKSHIIAINYSNNVFSYYSSPTTSSSDVPSWLLNYIFFIYT